MTHYNVDIKRNTGYLIKMEEITAHRNAISQIDLAMNEWMQREARYLITMIIVRSWQKSDLVAEEEFDLIDAVMIEEYWPKQMEANCKIISRILEKLHEAKYIDSRNFTNMIKFYFKK